MAAKNKEMKTNVMRLLEQKKIPYQAHFYEQEGEGAGSDYGRSVAEKLGENPAQVFKTLVLQGASREYAVCVIPVERELDLKIAAHCLHEKSAALIPVKELLPLTGYLRGGCSPIGMKKHFRVYLDLSAKDFPEIYISAGRIGAQVSLAPEDLLRITGGEWAAF